MASSPRFVLGINSQLVAIDLNRRLSKIVRNLTELPSIVVIMASGIVLRII